MNKTTSSPCAITTTTTTTAASGLTIKASGTGAFADMQRRITYLELVVELLLVGREDLRHALDMIAIMVPQDDAKKG